MLEHYIALGVEPLPAWKDLLGIRHAKRLEIENALQRIDDWRVKAPPETYEFAFQDYVRARRAYSELSPHLRRSVVSNMTSYARDALLDGARFVERYKVPFVAMPVLMAGLTGVAAYLSGAPHSAIFENPHRYRNALNATFAGAVMGLCMAAVIARSKEISRLERKLVYTRRRESE